MKIRKKVIIFTITISIATVLGFVVKKIAEYEEYRKMPYRYSDIVYSGTAVFYNNVPGDICKKEIKYKTEIFIRNKQIVAANDKYICCKTKDDYEILDMDGNTITVIDNIDSDYIELYDEYIYFINKNDSNKVYCMYILDGKNPHKALDISTDAFRMAETFIVYETHDGLYKYDWVRQSNDKLYDGMYCFFFCIDDNIVYLSDYQNNNMLIKIYLEDLSVEEITGIHTIRFDVKDSMIYYLPKSFNSEYETSIRTTELKNMKIN